MGSKRVLWAVNLPDGTPIIIKGVIADIDGATSRVNISARGSEIVEEILAQDPLLSEMFIVPGIDLAHEVHALVQAKHAAGVGIHDPLPESSRSTRDDRNDIPASEFDEVIDQTLLKFHRQSARLDGSLGGHASTRSLTDLRKSPVASDLFFLGRIAQGWEDADEGTVFKTVSKILGLLFRPAGEEQFRVPGWIWEDPLGIMLSKAKMRTIKPDEWMPVSEAMERLRVARSTIYRWMADGTFDFVHDAVNGRTRRILLRRCDVEYLTFEWMDKEWAVSDPDSDYSDQRYVQAHPRQLSTGFNPASE